MASESDARIHEVANQLTAIQGLVESLRSMGKTQVKQSTLDALSESVARALNALPGNPFASVAGALGYSGAALGITAAYHNLPIALCANLSEVSRSIVRIGLARRSMIHGDAVMQMHATAIPSPAEYCARCGHPVLGPHLVVALEDDGAPIPRDLLPYVFCTGLETRRVLANASEPAMDLEACASSVHELGGHVAVDSGGAHTRFRIFFPTPEQTTGPNAITAERGIDRNATILIVDDEVLVADYIASVLKSAGYTTLIAWSAASAMRIVQEHQDVELVITDQSMPDMGGDELAEALAVSHPSLKMVLCSGSPKAGIDAAKDSRFATALPKPVDANVLLSTVHALLEQMN